jgi:hypothetical protein
MEDPGICGRIILRQNFRKWVERGMQWIDLLRIGVGEGLLLTW